jgi:hypothetical protein
LTAVRPVGLRPDDASTTTTLTPPNYGSLCTPSTSVVSQFGSTIPSDPGADSVVFALDQVFELIQVPLDPLCHVIVMILGEGTNVPMCIVASVNKAIVFVLQTTLAAMQFCDDPVLGAENDSAWLNTIAIYNDLATDTENINEHLISIDSDLNTHVTAIDANVDSGLTAIDADIDAHVVAADQDLATRITNADTDLNNHMNIVDNDLTTVDTDVKAVGGDGGAVTALQAQDLQAEIESSLAAGIYVGLFETPKAEGGHLELVRTIVQTVINNLAAAGQDTGNAQTLLDYGNNDYAAGLFKRAYSHYMSAYQAATAAWTTQ